MLKGQWLLSCLARTKVGGLTFALSLSLDHTGMTSISATLDGTWATVSGW